MLKKKAMTAPKKMAWQRAEPEDYSSRGLITPQLIYTNESKDQIEVIYKVKPAGTESMNFLALTGDSSTAEKVRVAELEGYYTVNKINRLSISFSNAINYTGKYK